MPIIDTGAGRPPRHNEGAKAMIHRTEAAIRLAVPQRYVLLDIRRRIFCCKVCLHNFRGILAHPVCPICHGR